MYFLISLGIFFLFIFWIYSRPKNFPPGPPCLPLVGSLPFINTRKQPLFHFALENTGAQWGCKRGIMGFFIGSRPAVAVWDPSLVREILLRDEFQGRPDGFVFRMRSFGKKLGVFFGDGNSWAEQRRFALRQLRDLGLLGLHKVQGHVQSEIESLLEHIKSHPEGISQGSRILQGDGLFSVHIVNVLWALMSGKHHSREDAEFQQLLSSLNKFFRSGQNTGGFLNALPVLRFIAPHLSGYSEQKEINETVHEFIRESIQVHKATFNENNIRDFIDSYLLEMKQQACKKDSSFSEEELSTICLDIFSAGSESVSNTLSFALLYLGLNPDVQARLWEEMLRELGKDCCPCLEDQKRLPYLEAVILEVLRINPIAPLAVPHRATRPSSIAGYSIPKDTWLYMSLWAVSHDPVKWPEPNDFHPDRFIDRNGQVIHDNTLVTFGAGKRLCIGMSYAKSSIFLFLGALIANFEFRLVPGDPLPSQVSLPGFTTAPRPFRILSIERKKTPE